MFRQDMSESSVHESPFTFSFDVTFRICRRRDLRALEWFGMFYSQRELLRRAYARQLTGENIMLLAKVNRFPVGQVWIDLEKKRSEEIGILWALRVLQPFQGYGLGTRLIAEGEALLGKRGFACSELGVEKDNPRAKKLYQRLGYRLVGSHVETWEYITPEGERMEEQAEEWILQKLLLGEPNKEDSTTMLRRSCTSSRPLISTISVS